MIAGSVIQSSHVPGAGPVNGFPVRSTISVAPRTITKPVRAIGVSFCRTETCSVILRETVAQATDLVGVGTADAVKQGDVPYGSEWAISSRAGGGYIGLRSAAAIDAAPTGPITFAFDGLTNRATTGPGWVKVTTFGTTGYREPIDTYTIRYDVNGPGRLAVAAGGVPEGTPCPTGGASPGFAVKSDFT
jgi:hypothetical protein